METALLKLGAAHCYLCPLLEQTVTKSITSKHLYGTIKRYDELRFENKCLMLTVTRLLEYVPFMPISKARQRNQSTLDSQTRQRLRLKINSPTRRFNFRFKSTIEPVSKKQHEIADLAILKNLHQRNQSRVSDQLTGFKGTA